MRLGDDSLPQLLFELIASRAVKDANRDLERARECGAAVRGVAVQADAGAGLVILMLDTDAAKR